MSSAQARLYRQRRDNEDRGEYGKGMIEFIRSIIKFSNVNNRELAIILWLLFLLVILLFVPKFRKVKASTINVIKAFFGKKLVYVWSLMLIYVLVIVCILYKKDLWYWSNLKDTIVWFIFFGIASLMNSDKFKENKSFFLSSVLEYFKAFAIVELIFLHSI